MEKEKFIALLSKKHAEQLDLEEIELLNQAIIENEAYKLIANQLGNYLQEKGDIKSNPSQLAAIWERIEIQEQANVGLNFNYFEPKRNAVFIKIIRVAAVLVVLMGIGILGYKLWFNPEHFDTIVTSNEKTFKLLDDGTKIWLNKNSKLSYNTTFGKKKREIILTGEAYFDVAKNKAIPLYIQAGNVEIAVKGTAFNVNAYQGKNDIKVALVRGLIQVTDRLDRKRTVLLHPNEKFTLNHNQKQVSFLASPIALAALLKETSWRADTLTFNKEKLVDLAIQMEKKFDVKIVIESEKLKEKRFSGTFVNENIQQALEALKLSYPLTYTINNRLVVIKDGK